MTLEQMKLDRRDFTHDEEYDPLDPTRSKQLAGVDVRLKSQKHYLGGQNMQGG